MEIRGFTIRPSTLNEKRKNIEMKKNYFKESKWPSSGK